eukprot:753871-Hanusia_phi.AAC.2
MGNDLSCAEEQCMCDPRHRDVHVGGPCGVGINFHVDANGNMRVKSLKPGGPADRCNAIHPGDVLVMVDGQSIMGLPLHTVSAKVTGISQTTVNLGFRRGPHNLINCRMNVTCRATLSR